MLIGCFRSVDMFHITKLSQVLFSKTVNMQLITEKHGPLLTLGKHEP